MHIEYQINEDDFVSAGRLFIKTRRATNFYRRVVVPALWVVFGFSGYVIIRFARAWNPVLLLLVIPVLFPAFRLLIPWQLRRNYRKAPILHSPRTLDVDNNELHFASSFADTKTTWEPYIRFVENDRTFILVQQGNLQYFPLPKRELTPNKSPNSAPYSRPTSPTTNPHNLPPPTPCNKCLRKIDTGGRGVVYLASSTFSGGLSCCFVATSG
jgi:hypothetical protein